MMTSMMRLAEIPVFVKFMLNFRLQCAFRYRKIAMLLSQRVIMTRSHILRNSLRIWTKNKLA